MDHDTIELVLIAVTAAAVLLQAFVLLAMYLGLRKSSQAIVEHIEDLKSSVTPFIESTGAFLKRVGPKVEGTTADVAEIVRGIKMQAIEVEASITEISERVRKQASRVDEMFSGLLQAVDRTGEYVVEAVSRPVRQVSGVLEAVKAIIESFSKPIPAAPEAPAPRDREPVA
jgi:methyl-accepting chemotaxis protein